MSVLARLQCKFNVSTAEMERLEHWQAAILACALVNDDAAQSQRVLQSALDLTEKQFDDVVVFDHPIEIIF